MVDLDLNGPGQDLCHLNLKNEHPAGFIQNCIWIQIYQSFQTFRLESSNKAECSDVCIRTRANPELWKRLDWDTFRSQRADSFWDWTAVQVTLGQNWPRFSLCFLFQRGATKRAEENCADQVKSDFMFVILHLQMWDPWRKDVRASSLQQVQSARLEEGHVRQLSEAPLRSFRRSQTCQTSF